MMCFPILCVANDLETTAQKEFSLKRKKIYMKSLMSASSYIVPQVLRNHGIYTKEDAYAFGNNTAVALGEIWQTSKQFDMELLDSIFDGCPIEESIYKIIIILYIQQYIEVQNLSK
jgi:hypothetical protein